MSKSVFKKILEKFKSFKSNGQNAAEENNCSVQQSQKRNLMIAVFAVVGLVIFVVLVKNHRNNEDVNTTVKPQTIDFASPLNHVSETSIWVQRAENQMDKASKATKNLQESAEQVKSELSQQKEMYATQQQQIKDMFNTIHDLQKQLGRQQQFQKYVQKNIQKDIQQKLIKDGRFVSPADGHGVGGSYYGGPQMASSHITLATKSSVHKKEQKKTPDTWVSPGAFVTAAVLQGVDAAAGVTSQSDPRPVLLRTISNGTLAGGYHSHLKGCFIIGSGYGDASSERVYVRLESMSCTRNGIEYDYPVFGYLSGTDSKTGQHGPIVFRDGPFVRKAFMGGVLAAAGNIGQQYSQNYSTSPLGTVATVDVHKLPYALAGGGLGTAGQMYAQYNIRRAEQYQPVVEFSAGNIVNLVFTKGFWLDGHKSKTQSEKDKDVTSAEQDSSQSNSEDFSDHVPEKYSGGEKIQKQISKDFVAQMSQLKELASQENANQLQNSY